jgi:hypothetical protein
MSQQQLAESNVTAKQQISRSQLNSVAASPPQNGFRSVILQLQRTLGNQRVAQLIQARRITPDGKIIGLQRKLTVGAADDQYEQEADHVARQVVSMPDSVATAPLRHTSLVEGEASHAQSLQSKPLPLAASITPFVQKTEADEKPKEEEVPVQPKLITDTYRSSLQRQSATEEEEPGSIQPKSAGSLADSFDAGPNVESRLSESKGRGSQLPDTVRTYMEPRFGLDFSHVRVHTGSDSLQMNRAIGAQAFTHGTDVYYGAGSSPTNLELTAHELTHVVQQSGASAGGALQRQPDMKPDPKKEEKAKAPKDVPPQVAPSPKAGLPDYAVLLAPDENFVTLATVVAPNAKILHATSVDDLTAQLKTIKGPIGTIYFVAHTTDDGSLMFETGNTMNFVLAETVAARIKGTVQVDSLDFRGCQAGQAPGELDKIRVALSATKVTGGTCTLVTQVAGPIKSGGKPITKPEQLKDSKVKAAFDAGLKKVRELFLDNKKKCIINDTQDGYFQTGGKLIAVWANPESMAEPTGWDDTKSICHNKLKTETIDPTKKLPVIDPEDCKLIEVGKKKP